MKDLDDLKYTESVKEPVMKRRKRLHQIRVENKKRRREEEEEGENTPQAPNKKEDKNTRSRYVSSQVVRRESLAGIQDGNC